MNCVYYMELYGFMGSCDMLPLCGMPNPALAKAWAQMGPCLAPGPLLSTTDLNQKAPLKTQHAIFVEMCHFVCFSCFV